MQRRHGAGEEIKEKYKILTINMPCATDDAAPPFEVHQTSDGERPDDSGWNIHAK